MVEERDLIKEGRRKQPVKQGKEQEGLVSQGKTRGLKTRSQQLKPRGISFIFISLDHMTSCNTQPPAAACTNCSSHQM